jgi:hypothetical protein
MYLFVLWKDRGLGPVHLILISQTMFSLEIAGIGVV